MNFNVQPSRVQVQFGVRIQIDAKEKERIREASQALDCADAPMLLTAAQLTSASTGVGLLVSALPIMTMGPDALLPKIMLDGVSDLGGQRMVQSVRQDPLLAGAAMGALGWLLTRLKPNLESKIAPKQEQVTHKL